MVSKILLPDRGSITGRTVVEGRTVHIADVMTDPEFTWFEAQKCGGFRTSLGVPLMRKGTPIRVFFLAREKIEPIAKQEINLVTAFVMGSDWARLWLFWHLVAGGQHRYKTFKSDCAIS
jgi:signal transduction protein with GAF and PtsI domain